MGRPGRHDAWAAAALATVALAVPPIVTLIPLLVLATTFEITFALHTGVERVGRYIQVFYEEPGGRAGWEHRIMEFGRPGTRRLSTDPLFVRSFLLGIVLNFIAVIASGPVAVEWAVLGIAHALLAVRILAARREAGGQRAADLARFNGRSRRLNEGVQLQPAQSWLSAMASRTAFCAPFHASVASNDSESA